METEYLRPETKIQTIAIELGFAASKPHGGELFNSKFEIAETEIFDKSERL